MKILNKLLRQTQNFYHDQIETRLFPRQKWLYKVVPRHFADIDYLIEEVTFAALINYWENDDGESSTRTQYEYLDNPEEYFGSNNFNPEDIKAEQAKNKELYDEMAAAYQWAKTRHGERKRIDELTQSIYQSRQNGEKKSYERVNELEEEFQQLDTLHLTNIIKRRQSLWS